MSAGLILAVMRCTAIPEGRQGNTIGDMVAEKMMTNERQHIGERRAVIAGAAQRNLMSSNLRYVSIIKDTVPQADSGVALVCIGKVPQ